MAKSIGSLSALLTLNAKGFTTGLRTAMRSVTIFRRAIGSAVGSVFNLRNAILAGTGAAVAHFIDRTLQAADAQIDLAKTLNTSVKGLQSLQMVAKEAGVDSDQLTTALQFMSKTLGNIGGNKQLLDIFKNELKLPFGELRGLKADEQFNRIAIALSNVSDANRRAFLSSQIFGRGAGKLNQLIGDNNDKLQAARRFIEQAGLAWSDELSPGIEAANDSLQRAKSVFKGIATQIAVQLAPVIESISNSFIKWATAGQGVSSIVAKGLDEVLRVSGYIMVIWEEFRAVWNDLSSIVNQFVANFLRGYARINNAMSGLLNTVGLSGQAQKFAVTPQEQAYIDAFQQTANEAAARANELRNSTAAADMVREIQALRGEFRNVALGIEKLPRGVQ